MNEKLKAIFKISHDSSRVYIDVVLPNGNNTHLWSGLIELCLETYSNNDIKEIYIQLLSQINDMDSDDVPLVYREMIKEISITMANRKIKLEVETIVQSVKEGKK